MDKELAKVREAVVALSSYGSTDLSVQEKVDALVSTAYEVNEQMKVAKAEDTAVKDEFKRMCKPHTDAGHGVTCYSFINGMKMTLTVSGGGMEVNEGALIAKLYEKYGEQMGDRTGKAWRAFCAISDPLDMPRKLNPDKLAYEVAKAERIASGMEAGEIFVTGDMVGEVTTKKNSTLSAKCSPMTKDEVRRHECGELNETMVLK